MSERLKEIKRLYVESISIITDFIVAYEDGLVPEQVAALYDKAVDWKKDFGVNQLKIRQHQERISEKWTQNKE